MLVTRISTPLPSAAQVLNSNAKKGRICASSSRNTGSLSVIYARRSNKNVAMDNSASLERQRLFSTIVPVYDQINEVMSLGQHREWKKLCVQYSACRRGSSALDLCCGSGDVTQVLANKVGKHGRVVGLDFSAEMLKAAKERTRPSDDATAIEWIEGDAQDLPFEGSTFDAVTISYGLRNVTNIPKTLREIHRVLKHRGRVSALDFNNSSNLFIDSFQEAMLANVVVPVATLFGMRQEYQYLRQSIKNYPTGLEQERLALDAGFAQASHYVIANGLMGILVAQKT